MKQDFHSVKEASAEAKTLIPLKIFCAKKERSNQSLLLYAEVKWLLQGKMEGYLRFITIFN